MEHVRVMHGIFCYLDRFIRSGGYPTTGKTGLQRNAATTWQVFMYSYSKRFAYSGKIPSTRQTYDLATSRLRICCSISRAFFGLRPNSNSPDVSLSKRWIVLKFFNWCSLARMKTTVLCLYLPQGCTCNIYYTQHYIVSRRKSFPRQDSIITEDQPANQGHAACKGEPSIITDHNLAIDLGKD